MACQLKLIGWKKAHWPHVKAGTLWNGIPHMHKKKGTWYFNFSSGEVAFHNFASLVMICERDQSGFSSATPTCTPQSNVYSVHAVQQTCLFVQNIVLPYVFPKTRKTVASFIGAPLKLIRHFTMILANTYMICYEYIKHTQSDLNEMANPTCTIFPLFSAFLATCHW